MKLIALLRRYSGVAAFWSITIGLALASTLLAAIGAWSFWEFRDQMSRYQSYRELQRHSGKADSLSSAYSALQVEVDAIHKSLPEENTASYALNALVEGAHNLSLGISGITAMDEISFPDYTELPFELHLAGNFHGLLRYLRSLESQGLAMQVRRLEIKSEKLNRSNIKARLEVSILAPRDLKP